ncbi:TetR/AcrR family transcriptional regulator [Streptomyces sp. AS02]|uniref:TetR/AcrR family transcriptional regulator n=1 Tax=Streptomyces sp. AS02 TaxID=2938946 RepID=UPI0020221B29|nr:TetR/AcrR family transcriptional regulator [Streptomyces sp. AS02]MCL8016208.1 TetR/AcrR family transcriptional regulator [Streptomyces sp. AS02]
MLERDGYLDTRLTDITREAQCAAGSFCTCLANKAEVYLEAHKRNAKLMGLLEQVAQVEPEVREFRSRRADAFIRRNARGIADLQARGVADRQVDPLLASRALAGMVSVMACNAFVLGERQGEGRPADFEELVSTVTRLWANDLRFPDHRFPGHRCSGGWTASFTAPGTAGCFSFLAPRLGPVR